MVRGRNRAYDQRVGDALGWMQTDAYMDAAERAMRERVREPLLARGIPVEA
jgi:hypothetical protein